MKVWMKNRISAGLAVAAMVATLSVSPVVEAMPPPVEVALKVVGQGGEDRREMSWTLTLVADGINRLESTAVGDQENTIEFRGDDHEVTISNESEAPWNLMWSVLWSENPYQDLANLRRQWTDESGRVEVVGGELAYCYGPGDRSRLCIDTEARRILALTVTVDGVLWELRSSQSGERLQVTADGSLVARLSGR